MSPVVWTPHDLAQHLNEVLEVFGEAMSYRRDALEVRRGYIKTHLGRPQFRAVATLDGGGRVVGFGYGYHSQPGQWWHDQVKPTLPAQHQSWLASCFEVVELHVRPSVQGRGIGEAQLRTLLALSTDRTAMLSTPEADESVSRAWRLYRRMGFVDLVRQLMFPGDPRPFAILGRQTPLSDG